MSFIKQQVAMLSDEQLAKAFDEIQDWKSTSILSKGIVRDTHTIFEKHMDDEMDLRLTEGAFLFEMGRRFAQQCNRREREALRSFPRLLSPFQELQEKYLSRNVNGDVDAFDNDKLTEHDCWHLQSDLLELFESGRYYTNNKDTVNSLITFLKKEGVPYKLNDKSIGFNFVLKIKDTSK